MFHILKLSWGFWLTSLVLLTDRETSQLPRQKLATYFKLKSPDSNSVPGVTQLFAAFRTYKSMDSSIS
jgi:hypothetical protein